MTVKMLRRIKIFYRYKVYSSKQWEKKYLTSSRKGILKNRVVVVDDCVDVSLFIFEILCRRSFDGLAR
jgi:hypothetical protein